MRFDVPVVGLRTLEALVASRAAVLAIEAYRTLLLDKPRFLAEAKQAGVSIVGVTRKGGVI
jgi:DUF1009 family protein